MLYFTTSTRAGSAITSSPVSADLAVSQEQPRNYSSSLPPADPIVKISHPHFARGRQTPRPQVWSSLQTDVSFMKGGPPALSATRRTKRHVFKSCFSPATSPRSPDARLTFYCALSHWLEATMPFLGSAVFTFRLQIWHATRFASIYLRPSEAIWYLLYRAQ